VHILGVGAFEVVGLMVPSADVCDDVSRVSLHSVNTVVGVGEEGKVDWGKVVANMVASFHQQHHHTKASYQRRNHQQHHHMDWSCISLILQSKKVNKNISF
jgi:hypothetical protein